MWRTDQVGNQLQRQTDVRSKRSSMEHGLVARCPGVERTSDVLDRFGDGTGVSAPRTLEHHMLDQVRQATLAVRLGAGPDKGMKPDCRRLRARHGVDGNGYAIGKAG